MFITHTRPVVYSATLLGLVAIVISTERMATSITSGPVQAFEARVSEYTRLRRQIVQRLQTDGLSPDEAPDTGFRRALTNSIREARRNARAGDVFGLEMTDRIRQIVRVDLSARKPADREAILSEVPSVESIEGVGGVEGVKGVRVNDCYPDGAPFATMPPLLLMQLVPLPPELQYRFLDDAVILLDIDAHLIVDVIPNALRRST